MNSTYNFTKFVAAWESDDFDNPSDAFVEWAANLVKDLVLYVVQDGRHKGDCTNHSEPCLLCTLGQYLELFEEYSRDEEKFREKYV